MKLTIWVEARPAKQGKPIDDVTLFVAVNKLDDQGNSVRFHGTVGVENDMVTRGQALASWRQLDEDASTEWLPVLSGTQPQPLGPGEVVRVDIPLSPSSTFFAKGESIQLIVAAQEVVPTRPFINEPPPLSGQAIIHMGGARPSHLLIPVIPVAHDMTVD